MEFNEILSNAPYSMAYDEKQTMLLERLNTLHGIHYEHCVEYRNLINSLYGGWKEFESVGEFPFLPVALFKELELKDIDEKDIFKIMTSSGTTGQRVSKIFLNRETANNQQKALTKIVADFTGSARMPMLILDCPSVVRDRRMFSARGAGILGFSIFGTKKVYALNDDMQLNVEELQRFLEINRGKRIFLFGFTFMVWQHFYRELL